MDVQSVATQVINFLGQNPQLITQFIEHPYSTTAQATGSDVQISKEDMSQVVTEVAAISNNQQLGMNDIATIASALMGQNNNSVHSLSSSLLGSLLGGGQASGGLFSSAQAQPTSSLATSILGNLAGAALGSGGIFSNKSAIDLSDGFGLDDALGIASLLFKK